MRSLILCVGLLASCSGSLFAQGGAEVAVEPYKGPAVYLPEPAAPPPASEVGGRETVTQKYEGTEQIHVERGVLKFSDDTFVNDGPYREFYADGQLFVEGEFERGKQVGEWTYNHPNGKLAKKVKYVDGAPDGVVEVYDPEGKLKAKRSYKAGKRDGAWVLYNVATGKPLREENFVDGERDGAWVSYFDDGSKQQEGTFARGKPEGIAKEWDREGKLRAEVNFVDGLRDGKTTIYTSDGKEVVQEFAKGKPVVKATK